MKEGEKEDAGHTAPSTTSLAHASSSSPTVGATVLITGFTPGQLCKPQWEIVASRQSPQNSYVGGVRELQWGRRVVLACAVSRGMLSSRLPPHTTLALLLTTQPRVLELKMPASALGSDPLGGSDGLPLQPVRALCLRSLPALPSRVKQAGDMQAPLGPAGSQRGKELIL